MYDASHRLGNGYNVESLFLEFWGPSTPAVESEVGYGAMFEWFRVISKQHYSLDLREDVGFPICKLSLFLSASHQDASQGWDLPKNPRCQAAHHTVQCRACTCLLSHQVVAFKIRKSFSICSLYILAIDESDAQRCTAPRLHSFEKSKAKQVNGQQGLALLMVEAKSRPLSLWRGTAGLTGCIPEVVYKPSTNSLKHLKKALVCTQEPSPNLQGIP